MAELALGPAPASRTLMVPGDSSTLVREQLSWPLKDPDEVMDYGLDWSNRLDGGDLILTSEWLDKGLLDIITAWYDAKLTKVWIKGGRPDTIYFVTNRITTARGCTMDQTATITISKAR